MNAEKLHAIAAAVQASGDDDPQTVDKVMEGQLETVMRTTPGVVNACQDAAQACTGEVDPLVRQGALLFARWVMNHSSPNGKRAAFGLMSHLAHLHHPEAALLVGLSILRGDGTKKDPFRGLDLLYQACIDFCGTGIETIARGFIGEAWSTGELGKLRADIAVRHMETAANFGDGRAAFNLGIYFEGRDRDPRWRARPLDTERAAYFYELASKYGNVKGRTNLGILHYYGVLRNSDPVLGAKYLRQSAAEGDAIAADALTRIPLELARAGLEVPKIPCSDEPAVRH